MGHIVAPCGIVKKWDNLKKCIDNLKKHAII